MVNDDKGLKMLLQLSVDWSRAFFALYNHLHEVTVTIFLLIVRPRVGILMSIFISIIFPNVFQITRE